MTEILSNLPIMIITIVISLAVYYLLKFYLLNKIKLKRNWILIILVLGSILIPELIGVKNIYVMAFFEGLSIIFLLWFIELVVFKKFPTNNRVSDKKSNGKKDIVIRPKAKPNRVKNKSGK